MGKERNARRQPQSVATNKHSNTQSHFQWGISAEAAAEGGAGSHLGCRLIRNTGLRKQNWICRIMSRDRGLRSGAKPRNEVAVFADRLLACLAILDGVADQHRVVFLQHQHGPDSSQTRRADFLAEPLSDRLRGCGHALVHGRRFAGRPAEGKTGPPFFAGSAELRACTFCKEEKWRGGKGSMRDSVNSHRRATFLLS